MKKVTFLLIILTIFSCSKEEAPLSPLQIPKKSFEVAAEGGVVEVYMQTNTQTEVSIEDCEWLHHTSTKSMNLETVSLVCDANNSFEPRTTQVIFSSRDKRVVETVTITQEAYKDVSPKIISFVLEAAKNPNVLIADVIGIIGPDNKINLQIPYIISQKKFIPTIKYHGKILGETSDTVDFSQNVKYTLENGTGDKIEYTVTLSINNFIPIMWITTENRAAINSKDIYVNGSIKLEGNGVVPSLEATMQIKGRGNTTWSMAKKPYRIKFDKKQSLAGLPEHKDWALLANFSDKTALRTELAFDISRRTSLAYTPRTQFVDIILNEIYIGTYQITEHLKIDDNRINTGKEGFLLEVDQLNRLEAGDVYFKTPRSVLLCIKEPDVANGSDKYNWVKDFVSQAETILYSANFKDPIEGYAKYLDVQSFADWYLVNEIARNNDAVFFSSCYMNVMPGGKIKMGPVWDFDIAFGNCNYNGNYNAEGFWVKNSAWISRLFQDPAFVSLVKQRFAFIKSNYGSIMADLNVTTNEIKLSQEQNNKKWDTQFNQTWPNYAIYGSYDNEVSYMKDWLNRRMTWLETEFGNL